MNVLELFAGAGGGILGGNLLGWRTVCAVELDPYCRDVLMARQNDGTLEPFPIWDDIRTFDGKLWRDTVDVVAGGFPCQDISLANANPTGIDGERSGLWSEMARVIGEVGPRWVLVENVPALTSRGLGRVLGDLVSMGFDAEWGVLGAWHVGAPHRRDRLWIVGRHADGDGESGLPIHAEVGQRPTDAADAERDLIRVESGRGGGPGGSDSAESRVDGADRDVDDADSAQREGRRISGRAGAEHTDVGCSGWWEAEPDVGRVAHGVAARMDRLRAIGNGQVPAVVALAWRVLSGRLLA